jgi:hypothetical protein
MANFAIYPGETYEQCLNRLLQTSDAREPVTQYLVEIIDHFGLIESGPVGPPGPQGIQGVQGPQGNDGGPGPAGPPGADSTVPGPPGAQGDPGADGADGTPGANGRAATVTAGTTVTGAAGTMAMVINSGTTSDAVFNFTIPSGIQGSQGIQGPAGVQGIQGPPGPQGPQGNDGTSVVIKGAVASYSNLPASGNTYGDLWITTDTGHGWVWSAPAPGQWVDVGPIEGPPGPTGATGPTGAQGPAGATGATGPQGATGATGAASTVPGPQGPQGIQGNPGPTGSTGAAGAAGAAGLNAWTLTTTSAFTVPAYGASVTINVADTSWIAIGEWVYFDDASGAGVAGQLVISSKTPTSVTLLNPLPSSIPLADATQSGFLRQVSGKTTDFVDGTNHCQNLIAAIPAIPVASTTQNGLLKQVSGNTTDFVDGTNNCQPIAPQIWSVRLRSLNALGNPNFEIDQRITGAQTGAAAICDRWWRVGVPAAPVITTQRISAPIVIPGTSYRITNNAIQFTLTTAGTVQPNNVWGVCQYVEGSILRPLFQDVHSITILAASSVPSFVFPVIISNGNLGSSGGWVIGYLCTTSPTPNTPTLITIPNIPVWPGIEGTEWFTTSGNPGYQIRFSLCAAASASIVTGAFGQWQRPGAAGNIWGGQGQTNFGAQPVGSTFTLYYMQHEPGPICTMPIDLPFDQNLDACLRYYQKSFGYASTISSTTTNAAMSGMCSDNVSWVVPQTVFTKPLAKIATGVIYNGNTGAINSINNVSKANVSCAVTAVVTGEKSIGNIGITPGTTTAYNWFSYHYTADTGW